MPLSHHSAITERHVGCLVVHIKHGTYVLAPCSLAAGTDSCLQAAVQCCTSSATMQESRTKAYKRPSGRPRGSFLYHRCCVRDMANDELELQRTLRTLLGTKDSVTNVKNETNRAKDACIGYLGTHRDSYVLSRDR